MSDRKERIARRLKETRARTLRLLRQVPEEFFRLRVHHFYSPIGWHFGHVGMTEEFWTVHRAMRGTCSDDRLTFLFANLPENPKDNRTSIPDRPEIVAYLERTRCRALEALETADLDAEDPLLRDGYAWDFAIQHECQHQETIAELLHLIHMRLPCPPLPEPVPWESTHNPTFLQMPGGAFRMGSSHSTVYDNEKEPHQVSVRPFALQSVPVTCRRWAEFLNEGGCRDERLWSVEGWKWRASEQVDRPMYWLSPADCGAYYTYCASGVRALRPDEPVYGISWFEAEAFCRWAGCRMPAESEWEYAARNLVPDSFDDRSDLGAMDGYLSGPPPLSPAAEGLSGVGQVWEWTASVFSPYPGFRPFPYDGYSRDHMDGCHKVCRGASWVTAPPVIRPSLRNWYVPGYRQGFLGLRCAR